VRLSITNPGERFGYYFGDDEEEATHHLVCSILNESLCARGSADSWIAPMTVSILNFRSSTKQVAKSHRGTSTPGCTTSRRPLKLSSVRSLSLSSLDPSSHHPLDNGGTGRTKLDARMLASYTPSQAIAATRAGAGTVAEPRRRLRCKMCRYVHGQDSSCTVTPS
jgi:hypothetical protein